MVGQWKPPTSICGSIWLQLFPTELRNSVGLCQRTMAPGFSGSWQYKISLNQRTGNKTDVDCLFSLCAQKVATCCMKRKEHIMTPTQNMYDDIMRGAPI